MLCRPGHAKIASNEMDRAVGHLWLRHPKVPHHPHVFVLEDMAVVEVEPGMTCECHLHANGLAGQYQHRIPPPSINDSGTQGVCHVSTCPSDNTKLAAVHMNGMGGLHSHWIR
jgi:hypothetical protein